MPDRSIAPPYVKSVAFQLINPEVQKLPNGVNLNFIAGGSQEVIKIELIFEAGRWFERKAGSAYFAGQLLSKGTKQKNSFEIASIFDQYGAHLEVHPGLDFVSVSLYTVNKNLESVFPLLTEILSSPEFSEQEYSQTKSIFLQNLKVNNEKTSYVASQTFRENLFGSRHPYGVIVEEKQVNQLSTRDFQQHFQDFFHTPQVFISGKIHSAHRNLIIESFGELAGGRTLTPPEYDPAPGPPQRYLERKESVQSSVRLGKRSLQRSHPDYVPVLFVSHILGGYFGSRLMKNIREEKGLTYGISASLHGMKRDSYLVVGADVNKENTGLIFDEIRKELKRLRSDYISTGELETTRNHFIGSLLSEITTPFAHADKIKTINLFNLPPDHYQSMINTIDSITAEEIARISEQYFHEDSFIQVAVG